MCLSCSIAHRVLRLTIYIPDFAHADHANAARALIRGLAAHSDDKPGYLIHTSGARLLSFKDIETKTFGEASSKVYDDWDGVGEVISLPDSAPHRDVENIVLAGGTAGLKTAIVCPPTIYGRGRGPDNQRSDQLPELARYTLIEKHGIQIGAGNSYWTNVHITDLSKCYLLLVEAAVTGGGSATWGEKGYYFTENNEHVWGHISKLVAEEAHKQGLIPSDEVISFTPENANILKSPTAMTWGFNSRCRAIRARKVLGWEPKECKIEDTIADAVKTEAVSMGLIEGHAAKIAG